MLDKIDTAYSNEVVKQERVAIDLIQMDLMDHSFPKGMILIQENDMRLLLLLFWTYERHIKFGRTF